MKAIELQVSKMIKTSCSNLLCGINTQLHSVAYLWYRRLTATLLKLILIHSLLQKFEQITINWCFSVYRDYQEEADDCRKTPDTIYEDILMKTAMERRRRRIRLNKLQQAQQIDPKFGMNTLGHLRIDYSGNWNKLDRYICHPWKTG